MLKISKQFILFCTLSFAFAENSSTTDSMAIDTNALMIEWKHKTLTQNMIQTTVGPYCFYLLILAQTANPPQNLQFIPGLIFYSGASYGLLKGLKTIEQEERHKLEEIRSGITPKTMTKADRSINPGLLSYSMVWRSLFGLFTGAVTALSFEQLGHGLLKQPETKTHDGNYWIVWPIAGFYKGLDIANEKYGLPSGSAFKSMLLAGLVYTAFEYGYYRTVGTNEIPPIAQGITFSILYIGYNFDNWKLVFSRR